MSEQNSNKTEDQDENIVNGSDMIINTDHNKKVNPMEMIETKPISSILQYSENQKNNEDDNE